jgi:hypothetical protein
MQFVLIWYLISEFDDDDQPMSAEIGQQLMNRFTTLGFQVHMPTTPAQFRAVLQSLAIGDTVLHIFAHGADDMIAPFTMKT